MIQRAATHADEPRADDRRDDADGTEHQRVEHEHEIRLAAGLVEQAAEQHRGHGGDRIRFEQVGCHPGAIADVVADVVRDDRRVARIVFRNAGLELADQVGTDVGGLGVDAAAESGEDRDERCPEGEADQGVEVLEHPVREGDTDEPEADHEEPGDRAPLEGELEGGVDPAASGLGGAQVGAHRDVHADVPGGAAQHRADQKENAGLPPEREGEEEEDDRPDPGDDRVLPVEVCLCTLLDRLGDLLHPVVAFRLAQDPEDQIDGIEESQQSRCRDGQQDGAVEGRHALRTPGTVSKCPGGSDPRHPGAAALYPARPPIEQRLC